MGKSLLLLMLGVSLSFAATSGKSGHRRSPNSQEAEPPDSPKAIKSYFCRRGTRELRVISQQKKDEGCQVVYDRGGQITVEATARYDLEHCARVLEKIKDKLEKSGFKCS